MTISDHIHQPERTQQDKKQNILDAPGITVGKAVEWKVGNNHVGITNRERELIRQKCGVKKVNEVRALTVKNMMQTHSIAGIVKALRGRSGCGARTIAGIHAALSQAKGEGL